MTMNHKRKLSGEAWLTILCGAALALGYVGEKSGVLSSEAAAFFYLIAYLTGGYEGLTATLADLRKGQLNIDFLMISAATGAAVIGLWLEGAILLFLFSLSETLESMALGKSRRAIHSLMKLRPGQGLVRRPDGTEVMMPVEEIQVDQIVIVKPGEHIPVDGVVTSGQTHVDQSPITGESIPVPKQTGDPVFAATLNQYGVIQVRVTKPARDTTLSKIIELVEQAQQNQAATQRFLDRFEPVYAVTVVAAVLLLILIPWLLLGQEFHPVFYRAMTVLVVASPCALIISTPASIISAIANAARNGILFKGGVHLEQTARIDTFAFDKTGTLTRGEPVVTDLLAVTEGVAAEDRNGSESAEEYLLALAAGCELHSEHHLAKAILTLAAERGVDPLPVEQVQTVPGKGVHAVKEGSRVSVGNHALFHELLPSWPVNILQEADRLRSEGKTVIFVVSEGEPEGVIALSDRLRPEAKQTLLNLRKEGIGTIAMLTGDNRGVAGAIARDLEIDQVHAELLPDEKVTVIENLKKQGFVAMVGDGINDAPALAVSHLGIAMGAAGTDVALETADVVLMGDDLSKIPYLLRLSRKARRVVWQNITISLSVILLLLAGVFLIDLPLTAGVIGHEGSTLVVVLNGLRLLRTGSIVKPDGS